MPAKNSQRVRKLNIKQKKKVVKKAKTVPGSFRLFASALRHVWVNKRLFGSILLVYAALYLVLVKGLATGFQLTKTREAIETAAGEGVGSWDTASTLFGELIGTAGSASGEAAGVYQVILFVLMSLVIIWTLRQTFDKRQKLGLRAVFYQSMYPLIPYILVGLVLLLQLIPALIGITLYGIVVGNGIAATVLEQILWFLLLVMTFGISIYLLSSSVFASYIVTLPGMTPMTALRSASKLVRFRRFLVIRKALFFPAIVGLIMALIFMPLVLYATAVAEATFLIFILLLLLFTHSYFYVLYRELL